jgi:hypothetical protein
MDVHPPIGTVHSIKDVLIHVAIVAVGIGLALGAEQVVEAHHRAALVKHATQSFRAEFQRNIESMSSVPAAMASVRAQIDDVLALLAHAPSSPAPQKLQYPRFNFQLTYSASWDAAIATQAIGNMPYDEVQRYAEAFAEMKVFEQQEQDGVRIWEALKRFGDNPDALTPLQRSQLTEELHRYRSNTELVEFLAKDTLENVKAALP